MPTKTDRILSYLPFTFLPARKQSALRAIAGAVGTELQLGEATLARIMRSHWVDSADEGAALIDDLERIASMYGLAPLRDEAQTQLESVEQFRRRLKRGVRTLLQGRVTVRGLLNVAAEILDVSIPEGDDLDVWWKRRQLETVTVEPRGVDAAALIFGQSSVDVRGVDAEPAIVRGTVDLSQGANLEGGSVLRIQLDQDPPATVQLGVGVTNIRSVSLDHIRDAINAEFAGAASHDGRFLTLQSAKTGSSGRIEFEEVAGDAAFAVFGVPAHIYTGSDARHAEVRATVDIGGGKDLSQERFLRIVVDGTQRAEIDCAEPSTPGITTLNRVRDAINEALGIDIASGEAGHLVLRSPTLGSAGSIFLQEPAAQSCVRKVLDPPASFFLGVDPRQATAAGVRDLNAGVDLSGRAFVKVALDGGQPVTINCAGAKPAETTVNEIVAKLNVGLGQGTASAPQGRLVLLSPSAGKTGQIVFLPAEQGDALEDLFGFGPRVFHGKPALGASFEGSVDLSDPETVNFFGSYLIALQIDDGPVVTVDFSQQKALSPQQIAKHIDAALADDIAFSTTKTVGLTSTTTGHTSRIAILPLENEVRRRFVTRAPILDEAAQLVLGFSDRLARGRRGIGAKVTSQVDLQFGVDLSVDRWLNVAIDGTSATVDCAGLRPRNTTVEEVASKLAADPPNGLGIAHVQLDGNAVDLLLGARLGERRGTEGRRATFESEVDLSKGIELAPDAHIKIGVDAVNPVEVTLNDGASPALKTLDDIVAAINRAVAATVASHDGRRLTLTSRERGPAGTLVLQKATGTDVTTALFGSASPPIKPAVAATSASIHGEKDLHPTNDLSELRFLRVAVDGRPAFVVDCAGDADGAHLGARTPEEILTAINKAFEAEVKALQTKAKSLQAEAERAGAPAAAAAAAAAATDLAAAATAGVATLDGTRLTLSSATTGAASQIVLEPLKQDGKRLSLISRTTGSGSSISFGPVRIQDAASSLLGDVPLGERRGQDAGRVVFTSTVDLSTGVELAPDARIKIGVDTTAPVEVILNDGASPARKTLNEIVTVINGAVGATIASQDGRFLILASRQRGAASTLVFQVPAGTDATQTVFGFTAPRSYQADKAASASIAGSKDLSPTNDLRIARFLRVSVDGRPAVVIDCAAGANSDQVESRTPEEVQTAINTAFGAEADKAGRGALPGRANLEGRRLILASSMVGSASRIALEAHIAGDARKKLFGDVPDQTQGVDAVPAVITGEVALMKPVDLRAHRKLLLSVDSGRPVEIDIAGGAPEETTVGEIIAAINNALPGVASITAEGFLRLRAPSAGSGSTLEVLPRRYIELIEHPAFNQHFDAGVAHHGDPIVVHNSGVEDSVARVEVVSINGTVDPAVVNHFAGRKIGLNGALRPGESVIFEQTAAARITATIVSPLHAPTVIPGSSLHIENAEPRPLGVGLELPRGASKWTFMECLGPRFDEAHFDLERFPGGDCELIGMFDLSHLDGEGGPDQSIFAPQPLPEASASVGFRWRAFQGGAFELRLPSELRPVFGGRFDEARFGLGTVEENGIRKPRRAVFSGVVFDPKEDPTYITKKFEKGRVDPRDVVVEVDDVLTNVPLGFVANRVPFRSPRYLTRGDAKQEARIFLLEPDSGRLIELKAEEPGDWGNQVSVSVRPDGPGRYQIEIGFDGDRFESARSLVLGPPEEAETRAAPGVLRAKAAGVSARVTRNGTGDSE